MKHQFEVGDLVCWRDKGRHVKSAGLIIEAQKDKPYYRVEWFLKPSEWSEESLEYFPATRCWHQFNQLSKLEISDD